jgi:hypothetical protein
MTGRAGAAAVGAVEDGGARLLGGDVISLSLFICSQPIMAPSTSPSELDDLQQPKASWMDEWIQMKLHHPLLFLTRVNYP